MSITRITLKQFSAALFLLLTVTAVTSWRVVHARRGESQAGQPRARAAIECANAAARIDALLADLRASTNDAARHASLAPEVGRVLEQILALDLHESSDAELLRHAKALVQVGDFWLEAAHHSQAKRALHAAHERASALAARDRGDTEIKLLRGRIEAAMAMILRRQGEEAAARVWSGRQRSTMDSMFGRTDGTARWQHDMLERQHELAEQALARSRPRVTGQNHLDELAARARLSIDAPAPPDISPRPAVKPVAQPNAPTDR